MTDTKTELYVGEVEKPIYYVDMGNGTWIDNMGQEYTLSELATSIKKREKEEAKKRQEGLKTVLVEQGNNPVVQPVVVNQTNIPVVQQQAPTGAPVMPRSDVLGITQQINSFRTHPDLLRCRNNIR